MSSVFDNLMADLQLLKRDIQQQSVDLSQDLAKHTDMHNLAVGIMNTDPMNACRCFMVDFIGRGGGEVSLRDVENISGMLDRVGGSLAVEVRKFLTEEKHTVVESGGGDRGWHIGVHCTPGEAWLLANRAVDRFTKAAQSHLLDIRISPWSIEPYYQEDTE